MYDRIHEAHEQSRAMFADEFDRGNVTTEAEWRKQHHTNASPQHGFRSVRPLERDRAERIISDAWCAAGIEPPDMERWVMFLELVFSSPDWPFPSGPIEHTDVRLKQLEHVRRYHEAFENGAPVAPRGRKPGVKETKPRKARAIKPTCRGCAYIRPSGRPDRATKGWCKLHKQVMELAHVACGQGEVKV